MQHGTLSALQRRADEAETSTVGRPDVGKRSRSAEATASAGDRAPGGGWASGAGGARVEDWQVDDGLAAAMGIGDDVRGGAGRGGRPLPGDVRAEMERSFGEDFSGVRVHEGPEAAAVGAVAYTEGEDLYFQPGRFDPRSPAGKELLGHELTHVVQQRAGRVKPDDGPLGKDLALNSDAALEAEADAAGARAARGDAAGVSRAGGAGGGAAVQRYAALQLDGAAWKLSGGNKLLTRDAASKELYAAPQTILDGEQALANAGSFIRLAGQQQAPGGDAGAQVQQHGLHRVIATYRARGAQANSPQTPAAHKGKALGPGVREPGLADLNQNGAGALATFSQCIDTGRMVMGVTGGHMARDLEMPVGNVDGDNQLYQRQHVDDFASADFQNMKHQPSPTENGALTALNRQLLDFVDSRALRQLADQEANKTEVARFRLHARKLNKGDPAHAWVVLHTMKTELPAVYGAFATYAGIDAAAAPEVGEALVTYIAETKAGRAFKTNSRLYQALLAQLGQPALTQLGITPTTPAPRIQEIVKATEGAQHAQHNLHAQLAQISGDHTMWNMHWAGVVLKDGTDYASLENDASTKDPSVASQQDAAATATGGDINQSWRFQLYGTAQPGQSFHDHMLASGDFGDFASTARFRRPGVGEQAIGKNGETRVYALRMPAGTSPALAEQMRWELHSHDAADAQTASAGDFAAVLTAEVVPESGNVRVTDVRLLQREMPPRVGSAIEEALEMIDVWRLRVPGPPLVSLEALRERMRAFHYAVQYLLSLGPSARPVDRYVSVVSQNARKLELDAEIRPSFAALRHYAASVEQRRHPGTIDGFSIGLLFQMLTYLDTNLLWSYERDMPDDQTWPALERYQQAVRTQRQEADRYRARLKEAQDALPVLDRCDAMLGLLERTATRLFPRR